MFILETVLKKDNKVEQLFNPANYNISSIKELQKELHNLGIIPKKIKNFGRMSAKAKIYILLTGILLYELKDMPDYFNERLGIISYSREEADRENRKYYHDYIINHKTMGRGNLFVYTLPTSPIAEVSIVYNIKGGLFSIHPKKESIVRIFDQIEDLFELKRVDSLIAILKNDVETISMLIANSYQQKKGYIEYNELKNRMKEYNSITIGKIYDILKMCVKEKI